MRKPSIGVVEALCYTFTALVFTGWAWLTFWSPYGGASTGAAGLIAGIIVVIASPLVGRCVNQRNS